MPLDYVPIECPHCGGEARLYDDEPAAVCQDCSAVIEVGPRCVVCGCSELNACPGGCVWATKTMCSRCAMQEVA
jgi:primosomal protein N'